MVGAVLLAAGSGNPMQNEVEDKLLHPIGHSNAFILSCEAFLHSEQIDSLVIVYKDNVQLCKLRSVSHDNLCQSNPRKYLGTWWKREAGLGVGRNSCFTKRSFPCVGS